MANRTVSVALVADVGQYQSAMVRAASSTKGVGTAATTAGTQAQRGFEAAGRGATLLTAALAGGVVLGLKSVVDASADAEQSIGGAQAVFKDYADTVIASSKGADRALGLSANSYRELATIIGSQMKNAGVPLEDLADKTEGIIGIGADLAAQFGGSTQQAVEALSSAFRGELDPIERYGIPPTAAAVGAKAVEMGLAESATELSQNAKAMATLAIVTEQSADAQGAFSREADTAAGRAQRAAASWENLKVAVGDRLLPVWSALVDVLGEDVIPALGDVLQVGGDVARFFMDNAELAAALAAALAVHLVGGITAVTVAFNRLVLTNAVLGLSGVLGVALNLPAALSSAAAAVSGFMAAVAPLLAVGAVVYAITKTIDFATAAGDARDEIASMWDAVDDARGAEQIAGMADVIDQIESKIRGLKSDIGDIKTGLSGGLFMLSNGADIQTLNEYEKALDAAQEKQARTEETAAGLAAQWGTSSTQVLALADKYDIDLSQGLDAVKGKFRTSALAAREAGEGLVVVGDTAGMTKTQIEEATKAVEEWLKGLQQIGAGFVEPLGVYKGLLDEKTTAERAAAEATAAATDSSTDSWEDYVTDVTVSLDELATRLEEQLLAQDNWRANIATITQRGGLEVGQAIAAMGQEGVGLAAQMANGTDAEFQRMAALIVEDTRRGGEDAAAEFDQAMKIMAEIGAQGGSATALAVADKLNLGLADVRAIAAKYGVELASGLDPLLTALGSRTIALQKRGGGIRNADGNLFEDHQAEIAPGGAWRVWAEPETGGEAYIPLASSKRDRSMNIWRETGKRLNAPEAQYFAFGGISDVPRPRSTAPYGPPISTAGDATMQAAYDETTAWLRAHIGTAGSGAVTGQWMSLWNLVKTQIPAARMNSTFRPGDPGYHGRNKAIDFGFGSGPGGAGSAGLASINRLLHDQVGRNLAELIYDGIGDDRPDLKNGRPLTYSAATQAQHKNHVHAAVYDQGGPLYPGYTLAYNGTGKTEWVNKSREFSGGGGAGTVVRVAAPDLTGLTIQGRVTIDGDGIATIAGRVVNDAIGSVNRGFAQAGVR